MRKKDIVVENYTERMMNNKNQGDHSMVGDAAGLGDYVNRD